MHSFIFNIYRSFCLILISMSLIHSPLHGGSSGFVTTEGTKFKLDNQDFYFQGANFYRIGLMERYTDNEVYTILKQLAEKGIRVVRFWGFSCKGFIYGTPILNWANEYANNYNEEALRRLDLAIDAARQAGLKVILPLVNFEPDYCGIDWWAKQVIDSDDRHTFYTDNRVKQAYKNYIADILKRKNSIYRERFDWDLAYRDDPTIMAIELANEPHTSDWYEYQKNINPGQIVYEWLKEISSFVRSIDSNHLISSGEEGYKVSHFGGEHGYLHAWIHNGSKGVDFVRNINLPHIDFATVHIYPDNWKISTNDFWWVEKYLIHDRSSIAHKAGKPIILEETGFSTASMFSWAGYQGDRRYWLHRMYKAANQAGYAGTFIWQITPSYSEYDGYTFDFFQSPANAVYSQVEFMRDLSNGSPVCRRVESYQDSNKWGWEAGRSCRRPF